MRKTGSYGRPWIELEKPKPPRVPDHYAYWNSPPPQISDRCQYWLRQLDRGFIPNRYVRREGYDGTCAWFGVYLWEYLNLIAPAITAAMLEHRTTTM